MSKEIQELVDEIDNALTIFAAEHPRQHAIAEGLAWRTWVYARRIAEAVIERLNVTKRLPLKVVIDYYPSMYGYVVLTVYNAKNVHFGVKRLSKKELWRGLYFKDIRHC